MEDREWRRAFAVNATVLVSLVFMFDLDGLSWRLLNSLRLDCLARRDSCSFWDQKVSRYRHFWIVRTVKQDKHPELECHRWNDGFLAKNGSEFQESTSSDVGEGPRRLAEPDGVHGNPESSNYVVRPGLMPFGNYARRRTRTDRGKTPTSAIPTGLRLPAQGCEATSYPGSQRTAHPTPTGLCHLCAAEPQPLWGC